MVRLDLSVDKAEMLHEVLLSYLSELRMEIAYAQRKEFREFLRRRGELLEKIIQDMEKGLTGEGRQRIDIDNLRSVDIFQGLTDWELRVVAQYFQREKIVERVTLFEEGEKADRLFILEEGAVTIKFREGEEYEIHSPGRIVGWSFLVPPNRYTATVVTIVPSKLLVIQSPDFYYLIHKEPRMGVKIMANLAQVVASRLSHLRGSP